MSIQGPFPPSNAYSGASGAPQLSDYAQATLCSQLSSIGIHPSTPINLNLNAGQQNTFWFFRMYADVMMLYFVQNNASSYPPNYAQNFVNDLKFIATQAAKGATGFDTKLLQDIQTYISNPAILTQSGTINQIMANYNGIITHEPGPGYNPNTSYDFSKLTPDDMYNYYLIQTGIGIFNIAQGQNPNAFWGLTSTSATPLCAEMGQFMCTYFVQRDGWNTPALANDLNNFQTLIAPIAKYINADGHWQKNLALNAAYTYGYGPSGEFFPGLMDPSALPALMNGQWNFGALPGGSNNNPPPWWDVNASTQIQWSYDPDYTFLLKNDSDLAFYLQNPH